MPRYSGVRRRGRTWYIYYRVGGRQVEEPTTAETAREAHEIRAQRLREVEAGTWRPRRQRGLQAVPGYLFDDLVKAFLARYRPRSGDTRYYRERAKIWLRWFSGMEVNRITWQDVERFRVSRESEVGPSTVRKDLVSLGTLFRWAIARGLAAANPADPQLVRRPSEPARKTAFLSLEEERRLLDACPPWLARVVRWAINTGMDRAEIVNLTWADVDMKAGTVFAPRSKTGVARNLPLNETLREVLRECRRVRSVAGGGRVFLGRTGRPLTVNQVQLALARAYRRAGLRVGGPFKVFRHTFASRLAMAGVDMATIARLMGHSTATITDRYAHLSPRHLRAAMEVLDEPESCQRIASKNPGTDGNRGTGQSAN